MNSYFLFKLLILLYRVRRNSYPSSRILNLFSGEIDPSAYAECIVTRKAVSSRCLAISMHFPKKWKLQGQIIQLPIACRIRCKVLLMHSFVSNYKHRINEMSENGRRVDSSELSSICEGWDPMKRVFSLEKKHESIIEIRTRFDE